MVRSGTVRLDFQRSIKIQQAHKLPTTWQENKRGNTVTPKRPQLHKVERTPILCYGLPSTIAPAANPLIQNGTCIASQAQVHASAE